MLTHESSQKALESSLEGLRKLRSPVIGSLLILAILLGKGLICQHAPERAVFFDVMLMIPISMLAYREGLATGLVAGLVAAAGDLVITAQVLQTPLPVYLASYSARSAAVTRLFSMEALATITSTLSLRARRQNEEAERRTEAYLKRIYQLQRRTEEAERDARQQQEVFERDLLKYSSLVYLLEESAQKLYSNLDADRLFQSLFRVLEECFGSTSASVYLKVPEDGSYLLAHASCNDDDNPIPMILRPDQPAVRQLESSLQAVAWDDDPYSSSLAEAGEAAPAVISGVLLDKGAPTGIINVHEVDHATSPDPRLMGVVANIASIALANARLFGEVQWLAERDPLTKLYNRRTFHKQLADLIDRSRGRSDVFALLMLDIDHFKAFNDTYGHQAGDAVLEWFGHLCQQCAGDKNPLFRYGGEEFTLLMPGGDTGRAHEMAERMREQIERTAFRHGDMELKVTLSCGIAVFPENGSDGDDIVRGADRAMYRAKAAGRNLVAVARSRSESIPAARTHEPGEAEDGTEESPQARGSGI